MYRTSRRHCSKLFLFFHGANGGTKVTITLTYADATSLMRDLKAIGAHNATMGRPRGLTGRARWRRMLDALEAFRREGRLPATFEVVYGHAWKPEPRVAADGRAIVRFAPRAAR